MTALRNVVAADYRADVFPSFILDGQGVAYVGQLSFQFACYGVGIIFLYVVTVLWVTDSNYFHEDNVIVPEHVKEDAQVEGRVAKEDVRREHQRESSAVDKSGTASVAAAEEGSSKDAESG